MTGRLIRFPIAEPLETALVAATELDREQLEQLRDHVAALLAALPPPPAPFTMEHRHDQIADGGHRLRGSAAPNTTAILPKGHVAHVVELVLNRPVRSARAQQLGRADERRGQAGDLVVDLDLPPVTTPRLMDHPAHLLQARPTQPAELLDGIGVQRADLDATVPAVNGACAGGRLHVLESSAGEPAAGPAGCP